jgi:2-oxoglutarate ferredoxin oxidoreductase subunit gamma
MRIEIRISGFGGQGVVLAGYVLGKAVSLYEGKEAVMTQSYGPEARGGASSANVVLSDRPIAYPFVQQADVLIALSQEAYTRFRPQVKEGAQVLIDGELVKPFVDDSVHAIPATHLAEELGRRIVANMIMLGFFTGVTEIVSKGSMQRSLEASVKPKTVDLNLKAFECGYEFVTNKERVL